MGAVLAVVVEVPGVDKGWGAVLLEAGLEEVPHLGAAGGGGGGGGAIFDEGREVVGEANTRRVGGRVGHGRGLVAVMTETGVQGRRLLSHPVISHTSGIEEHVSQQGWDMSGRTAVSDQLIKVEPKHGTIRELPPKQSCFGRRQGFQGNRVPAQPASGFLHLRGHSRSSRS